MKTAALLPVLAAVIAVVAGIAWWAASFYVDPAARIAVQREQNGAYRFDIAPNFVVNSVYSVVIAGPDGTIAERQKPVSGDQQIVVAPGLTSKTVVTVRCRLQYDRFLAPSITTQDTTLTLP